MVFLEKDQQTLQGKYQARAAEGNGESRER
jgi:hypothetical protein